MQLSKVIGTALLGSAAVIAGTCFAVPQDGVDKSAAGLVRGLAGTEAYEIISAEIIGYGIHAPVKTPAGAITVKVVTSGHDGSFTFASTVPGASAFMLTTYAGTAIKSLLTVEPGVFTISQIGTAAGYGFKSLACSDGEIDGITARIKVSSGTNHTCTFAQVLADDSPQALAGSPAALLVSGEAVVPGARAEHSRFNGGLIEGLAFVGAGRFANAGIIGGISGDGPTSR
jgi:hypothetical protein